jgi:hypothetical protein
VTFRDLRKRVCIEAQQQFRLFERLQSKPFWIWNIEEHKQEISKQMDFVASIILLAYHRRMEMINHFTIMKK